MNEYISGLIVSMLCIFASIYLTIICCKSYQHKLLNDAGIEKLVRCNNASSNWVEIVWKDAK